MAETALTLGNFDGVHCGHAAILEAARARVGGGGQVVAVTFEPAPTEVLRPGTQPPRLMTAAARVTALRAAGADRVEVLAPDAAMLAQSPEAFIGGLVEAYRPGHILEGPDFRFGRGRAGDNAVLARLGQRLGFEAVEVPRRFGRLAGGWEAPISSSLCRWLVGRGRVAEAADCLGRPHRLTATIVRGEQRGRTLGIPTANLDPAALAAMMIPRDGVYAASATVEGDAALRRPAAVSIGTKPTFGHPTLTVEAHLIDAADLGADALYGAVVHLDFRRFLRDQFRYAGVEALVAQLQRDIAASRTLGAASAGA